MKGQGARRGAPTAITGDVRRMPLPAPVLFLWGFAAALPEIFRMEETLKVALLSALYGCSAIFALGACGWAAVRGSSRQARWFWGLCFSGVALVLAGYLIWLVLGTSGFDSLGFMPRDPMYALAYLLLFLAFTYLVAVTTRGVFPLIPLDTLAVMVSTGLLGWYFVLGRAMDGVLQDLRREAVLNFAGGVADAGLLFLALVVLSGDERPAFAGWLVAGLSVFVSADLAYFVGEPLGGEKPGGFPVVMWSLGMVLLGLAALRGDERVDEMPGWARTAGIGSLRTFLFWFGPLSPSVQYAFLAGWVSLHPPVPPYVLWAGAFFVVYFGLRTSALTLVSHGIRRETAGLARREEQARISEELRRSLERGVGEMRASLRKARAALDRGDGSLAGEELGRAEFEARQVGYQVSLPVEEMLGRCGKVLDPEGALLRFVEDLRGCFGLEVCVDLRAPFDGLDPSETAAVCRVVCEALWNAARHSRASDIRLESRSVGSVFVIRVRDDGCGFSPDDSREGFGIRVMHRRAAEIGAGLDIVSSPHLGTTVQLRLQR
ncbi:sensor histidine kinase [Rubrobacter calidifluminis]|uniref:sensor histidine kinase n=1 Tax=Rubrobacter calidifluminis TaxID=1392640 RepID=UPI002361A18A|nr:ATP-binding protein [Rubrobacter calidifluminis]